MGAQNFNFGPEFPKVGIFSPKMIVYFWKKIYGQEENSATD